MNRYAIEIREPRNGETIINQGQVIEMPVDGTVPMAVVVDGSDRWPRGNAIFIEDAVCDGEEIHGTYAVLHGRARGGRDGTPCHQRGGRVMSDLGPVDWTYDSEPVLEAFEQSLIGHRIVELEDTAMVLDDGTRLEFMVGSDCCALGGIDSFKAIKNLEQATVTAVTEVKVPDKDDPDGIYEGHYRVTIFGGDRRLAELDHTIDHSNGYYTSAVDVEVIKGKPGRVVGGTKKGDEDR